MEQREAAENSHAFDLVPLTSEVMRTRRGWRAFGGFFVFFGVGLLAFSTYFLAIGIVSSRSADTDSLAILLAAGVLVVAVSWPLAIEAKAYPASIRVSTKGFILTWDSGRSPYEFLWGDAKTNLRLVDRRGLSPIQRDGRSRGEFALSLDRGTWIPIPREAYSLILRGASEHRLNVSRKTIRSARVPGTCEQISIQGAG
jgi:hypothetical protein